MSRYSLILSNGAEIIFISSKGLTYFYFDSYGVHFGSGNAKEELEKLKKKSPEFGELVVLEEDVNNE